MKKHKYIGRIDYKHTHAYQVRICYLSSETTHSKLFSDGVYGGKRKALKAAIKWRDQIATDLGIEHLLKISHKMAQPMPRQTWKRNSSGIIGVVYATNYKNGKEGAYWEAKFQVNKKQCGKSFAVSKYGEINAFKWACKIRYEKAGKLYVYAGVEFPCKIPVPHEFISDH